MSIYTFKKEPQDIQDIKEMIDRKNPENVAALSILTLRNFEDNSSYYDRINFLRNSENPLSEEEKMEIRTKLTRQDYLPDSYFWGATPQNQYTPEIPFRISAQSLPGTTGFAHVFFKSSGASEERCVQLKVDPSTGDWFLNQLFVFADIRFPEQI